MDKTHSSAETLRYRAISPEIFWICFGVIALIAGSEVRIPLPWTPVPVTLQTFVVVSLALSQPPRRAVTAIAVYLLMGAIGAPIFSGWTSGLLRATTGYLLGFFLAVLVISSMRRRLLAMPFIKGVALVYLINDCIICASGMVWLHFWTEAPFTQMLIVGWIPFIPGGIVKTTAAYWVARKIN